MSNETTLVNNIKKAIMRENPNAVVWKIHGSPHQETGIPDLVCCVEGRFVALEVKYQRPAESAKHAYGRTSARQQFQIDRIRAAGGTAYTVLSVEEALEIVSRAVYA